MHKGYRFSYDMRSTLMARTHARHAVGASQITGALDNKHLLASSPFGPVVLVRMGYSFSPNSARLIRQMFTRKLSSMGEDEGVLILFDEVQSAQMDELTTIDRRDVEQGIKLAREAFFLDVIEPALGGLSGVAVRFLMAMGEDDGPSRTGAIAQRLRRSAASLGKYRERLLRDSLIVAPRRGVVDFSMPYMREYLRENDERLRVLYEIDS